MEERPLSHRLAALLALLALVAAAVVSAGWILADRADFRSLAGQPLIDENQPRLADPE